MNKKMILIFVLILVTLLVVFFWPKYCGNFAGVIDEGQIFKDCSCIGIKYYDGTGKPSMLSLGRAYTKICYGVPVKFSCREVKLIDGKLESVPISCE